MDQQTSLESLRKTSWKDFEFLVSEAFRRQGYQVDYSLNSGADGGVDPAMQGVGHGGEKQRDENRSSGLWARLAGSTNLALQSGRF